MITGLWGGGGAEKKPKNDYVICEWSLSDGWMDWEISLFRYIQKFLLVPNFYLLRAAYYLSNI